MGHAARSILPLVLAACGDARVCDTATCAEVCEVERAAIAAMVPEGGELLSSYELAHLAELRAELREGVQLADGTSLQVCTGSDRCLEPVEVSRDRPLPPGSYVVVGTFDVPDFGTWPLEVVVTCGQGDYLVEERRVIPITHREGGTRVEPLARFTSPQRGKTLAICKVLAALQEGPATGFSLEVPVAGDGRPVETWGSNP